MSQVLIATSGSLTCAVPIAHVVETLRPLPVEPLGRGPDYVLGIAVIRGEPTVVLDMARLFSTEGVVSTRYVVVRCGARKAALAFERVLGIRAIAPQTFGELPPLARSVRADVIQSLGVVDKGLVVVLEAATLYPAELG